LLALAILTAVLALMVPNFLTVGNGMNILRQAAVNGFISVGMLVVLITAGIDLSVGANAILSASLMGMLVSKFGVTNPVLLIAVAIASGILVGTINGLLLTKLKLPHPFVSTLGMKYVLAGLAMFVLSTKTISGFPKGVTWLGSASVGKMPGFSGVPVSFIAMVLVFIAFHVLLTRTALGRAIYCVGGNPEATRLSGINTDRVLVIVYALSGLVCAVAGTIVVGRTGVANPSAAMGTYDTDAIAACIIGGASFTGGKGTVWGTAIGVLMISVIRNGLTLLNVQTDGQFIVIGLVIVGAVVIDVWRTGREERRSRLARA